MFTLIKREITDHIPHLILAVALTATMVGLLVYFTLVDLDEGVGVLVSLGLFALVGCCSMGIAQVYGDRANKISPFLVTLPVTRAQILTARLATGVLAILIVLLPTVIAATVLLDRYVPPLFFYWRGIVQISLTLFLVALACYCLGLLIGSSTRKLMLVAGCLAVPFLMMILVAVKGFGPQAMAVLGLLILAAVARIVTKFISTPL
jgi:ABC-2 family transporter protein